MSEYVNNISKGYDARYQELESKLSNSEKNLAIVSQRTSSGSDVLNELGDKIMARLATSESNLLMLGVYSLLFRNNRLKIRRPSPNLWPKMTASEKTYNSSSETCRLTFRAGWRAGYRKQSTD